eukprot:TRINITY_DN8574_c0_g1_i1.p1 TRINITY_DN8574_c0_g1~~TRINITY_DN8574_c0_g1_i1.p1  ORF type:complete len:216 (-),score=16.47 TRINITY_DN8574_c0_g1_i1:34-660(-)
MEDDEEDTSRKPEPIEIVSHLFLGSWRSSRMLDRLLDLKVGLIVNCAAELENNYPDAFEYVHLELRDVPTATMSTMYQYLASKEMSKYISSGQSVLVHCQAGVSRSVAIILCYLMEHQKMRLKDALALVQEKRPNACPNHGFFSQLQALESQLFGEVSYDLVDYIRNVIFDGFEFTEETIRNAIRDANGDVSKALVQVVSSSYGATSD